MNDNKLKVIAAIEELGRTVTAAEVCHASGVDMENSKHYLSEIAMESSGVLQVDNTGNLKYIFQQNILAGYKQRSFNLTCREQIRTILSMLFYLVKIGVGVLLIVSLIILALLIGIPTFLCAVLCLTIGVLFSGQMDFAPAISGIVSFFQFLVSGWLSIFSPRSLSPSPGPLSVIDDGLIPDLDDREEKSFVLDCFSFLFGDGLPNRDFEERKWKVLGELIKQNCGVLVAEQMAPYAAPHGEGEALALPVLVHFHGEPKVGETGTIVYVFENFLKQEKKSTNLESKPLPKYLEAHHWQFTHVPFNSLWKVWMFSSLNFTGYYLLYLYKANPVLAPFAPAIDVLFYYSCAFIAIPAIRWLSFGLMYTFIDIENDLRFALADALVKPRRELANKLFERAQFIKEENRALESDKETEIVYDTSKALLDQDERDSSGWRSS